MAVNLVMGVIWMVFAGLAYTQLGGLPAQSALFPRFVILAMGLSGLLLVADTLIKHKRKILTEMINLERQAVIFQILIPGCMMLITYGLLRLVGFYFAGFLLMLMVFFYQTYRASGIKPTPKHLARGFMFAGAMMIAMYIMFTLLLKLPVPRGVFFS